MNPYRDCKAKCCKTGLGDMCFKRLDCACHTSEAAIMAAAAREQRDHAIARGDRYRITSKTRSA